LTVTITDAPDPAITGGVVTYTLVVTNNGKGTAGATTLTSEVPQGTSVYSLGAGCFLNESTVSCQVPSLATGSRSTFTILVTVTTTGAISCTAVVDPGNTVTESDKTNNSATTTTIVGSGTPATATVTPRATATSAPTPANSTPTVTAAGGTGESWVLVLEPADGRSAPDG